MRAESAAPGGPVAQGSPSLVQSETISSEQQWPVGTKQVRSGGMDPAAQGREMRSRWMFSFLCVAGQETLISCLCFFLHHKSVCLSLSLSLCFISVDADEIKRLGKRFKKLDLDNSGSLSVEEFMSLPELQQNPLVQRVIDIFDTDGNGEVDFKGEFKENVL